MSFRMGCINRKLRGSVGLFNGSPGLKPMIEQTAENCVAHPSPVVRGCPTRSIHLSNINVQKNPPGPLLTEKLNPLLPFILVAVTAFPNMSITIFYTLLQACMGPPMLIKFSFHSLSLFRAPRPLPKMHGNVIKPARYVVEQPGARLKCVVKKTREMINQYKPYHYYVRRPR